ncbi:ABC transporter substrate-binding protein [Clostridium transplantifaecale]|uniref:ABC transporter substrate-binding protein n=1 Tax=Clostridium transplantifaecale TaxID=2479838 RepID=UPI000F6314D7|nr:ABC transporter substrate-binding protein [Clostridium transplantifaecale]
MKNRGTDRIKRKRRTAAAAAGILAVGAMSVLSACGSGKTSTGEISQTQNESTAPGGQSAKGRYMEEEIALPEEIADNGLVDVVQKEDKSLVFCIPDENSKARLYSLDSKSEWTEGEAIAAPEGIRPAKMMQDENGTYYYGGFDENYIFHIWTAQEDGTTRELLPDVFKVQEGKQYGIIPDFIAALPGESFLVSQTSQADIYQSDGRMRASLAQDFIGMDVRIPVSVSGEEYLTLNNQKLVRYNLETGTQTGSYDLPDKGRDVWQMPVFTDDEGFVYVASQTGLYRTGRDGTVWEQLIDGSLNSMGRQDMFMRSFFKGQDNDYYGVFSTGDSKLKVLHYYYDETVDTVPPETLTIYALRDNATVRQAASILQKNNPQVKVDFRIAVEDEEEEVTEDVIRALNTELLNGKGADVLILDGLPMQTYKNKGILADITNLFEADKEDLLANVRSNFTAEDGKIYYMPARIDVPVIFGEPEAVAAFQDIDEMAAYDKTPSLFAPDIYENIINMTSYTCYKELFNENGTVDGDVLARYLTAVKSAGEKSNVQVSYAQADMERLMVNNTVLLRGFGRQDGYNVVSKRCAAGAEIFSSIDSAMLPLSAAEMVNSEIEPLGGIYMPNVVAGINASSQNRENAEAFIKTLFDTEVQDESLRDGFSVRSSSLDKWAKTESESSVSMSSGEGIYLSGSWPAQAERDKIMAIVRTASIPALIDQQIVDMIVDGSKDYLNGKETVEDAVQAIENKMKLYVNERE